MSFKKDIRTRLQPLLEEEEQILWTQEFKKHTLGSLFFPPIRSSLEWVKANPPSKNKNWGLLKIYPILSFAIIYLLHLYLQHYTENVNVGFALIAIVMISVLISLVISIIIRGKLILYFGQQTQESFKTPMQELDFQAPKNTKPFYVATTLGIFQYDKKLTYTYYENLHDFFLNDTRTQIIFREYKKENYTSIPILGNYDSEDVYERILPHWTKNNPQTKLDELTEQLLSKYNLKKERNRNQKISITGPNNLRCFWEENYPIRTIQIKIDYPNPTNSYFSFSEEHFQNKKALKNEPKVGDKEIDDTFFLETDNIELLGKLFTESLKDSMLNCYQVGTCNWTFGWTPAKKHRKSVKIDLPKKRTVDLTEILDYQMAHANYTPSYNEEDWDEKRISTLQLSVEVAPEFFYSGTGIEQLLLSSMASVMEMANTLEAYHSKISK